MQDDLVFFRSLDPTLDDQLLELYIAGECTPAEQRRFERWLADNPKSAEGIRAMRAASRAEARLAQMPEGIDIDAAEARIVERVDGGASTLGRSGNTTDRIQYAKSLLPFTYDSLAALKSWIGIGHHEYPTRGIRYSANRIGKVAAAAITTAALAIIAFVFPTSTFNPWNAESARSSVGFTYSTGNADHATVRLPDGSTVILNSASRLDVPADYGLRNRTLQLDGEALFNVVGQSHAPFVVVAGEIQTRVLGTRFIVRHYATDRTTIIAVQTGKVSVRDQVLTPRQRLEVLPNGVTNLSTINQLNETFVDGLLVFNGIPFVDAIAEINRWYDVDVRLGDPSLETRELRWKVSHSSIADLMEILEVTLNVRIVREGRVLTLYPRQ